MVQVQAQNPGPVAIFEVLYLSWFKSKHKILMQWLFLKYYIYPGTVVVFALLYLSVSSGYCITMFITKLLLTMKKRASTVEDANLPTI
jgi:hypothetical protein